MDKRLQGIGLTEEALQRLRDEHGRIWVASIRIGGPNGPQETTFLYREPRHADIDLMLSTTRTKPPQAHRNLLAAVILAPDRQDVIDRLRPFPLAISAFVAEQLLPLVGGEAEIEALEV